MAAVVRRPRAARHVRALGPSQVVWKLDYPNGTRGHVDSQLIELDCKCEYV